jgi:hypothetical protein
MSAAAAPGMGEAASAMIQKQAMALISFFI